MYKLKEVFNYTDIEEQIKSLGYQNPRIDNGDERQRQAWSYIEDNNLDIKLVDTRKMISDLSPRDNENFKYFQCRKTEDLQAIDDLVVELFDEKKTLNRLPIVFKIDGKIFPSMGNHRLRAFEKGFETYKETSVSSHVILVDPNDLLSLLEKRKHGSAISYISNRETGNETQPETYDDIAHQIQTQFELECNIDPSKNNWSVDERKTWGKKWCSIWKPDTKPRIVNLATSAVFSEHIGQSYTMPNDERIAQEWSKYFKNSVWNPETSKVPQKAIPAHTGNLEKTIFNNWKNRTEWSDKNQSTHLTVRIGVTMNMPITSEKTVTDGRELFIEWATEHNNNPNIIKAGFPLYTKIMFAQQTDKGYYEACEWIEDQGKFVNVTYEGEPKAALELSKLLDFLD